MAIIGLVCVPRANAAAEPVDSSGAPCELDIKRQSLDGVLQEIARQCGVQMVYFSQISGGLTAPGLKGRYALKEALRQVLDHTGLTFRQVDATTIEIRIAAATAPEARTGTNGAAMAAQLNGARPPAVDQAQIAEVLVTGTAEGLVATRVATPLKEIPQSISVISAEQMRQQNDTSLNDVLDNANGITALRFGSEFETFSSRGFAITTFHIDGGAPLQSFPGLVPGEAANAPLLITPDLGEFDHIEVLRGADALFGADSNPGGTINLVRKRPLDTDAVTTSSSVASWDNYRQEIDVTGPLGFDGALRGRMDVDYSQKNYFYEGASDRRKSVFAVLEYDLTPVTVLTAGASYTSEHAAPVVGGLPLFADGADPHLPAGSAFFFNWAFYDTQLRETYLRLEQKLGAAWRLTVNSTVFTESADYETGQFNDPIDDNTDAISSPPSASFTVGPALQRQASFEVTLTGSADWLGHHEEIAFGGDFTHTRTSGGEATVLGFGTPLANVYDYSPSAYPNPGFNLNSNPGGLGPSPSADIDSMIEGGLFASLKLLLTGRWSLTAGLRVSDDSTDGEVKQTFISVVKSEDRNKLTPYVGTMLALSDHISLYGSYADIYLSNDGAAGSNGARLTPADGIDMEGGLKGAWRHDALTASLTYYEIVQRGIAEFDIRALLGQPIGLGALGGLGGDCCYIPDGKNRSRGADLEISGAVLPWWLIGAGFTNNNGTVLRDGMAYSVLSPNTPRNVLKVWTSVQLPGFWHRWMVGGTLQAQSENSQFTGSYVCAMVNALGLCETEQIQFIRTEQTAYAIVSPRVEFEIDRHWKVALTINNALDRRYYQTVGSTYGNNWYGAPRNYLLKLEGRF